MGPTSKWSFVWIMKVGINCKIKCCTLGCLQNYPCNFCMTFVQKDKTAMLDLEIDSNLHYSHKGSFWGGSHHNIMCEKLHIWTNYRGVFPWYFCKCAKCVGIGIGVVLSVHPVSLSVKEWSIMHWWTPNPLKSPYIFPECNFPFF